MKINRIADY